jgi:hypothetical protein
MGPRAVREHGEIEGRGCPEQGGRCAADPVTVPVEFKRDFPERNPVKAASMNRS